MCILYFLLWIIFNGKITPEIILFGIVIATIMLAFTCKFMDYSLKKELRIYTKIGKALRYIVLLIVEVGKANISTIRLILSQKEEIVPTLVTFESDISSPVGKAMLSNAITLTPGTITVSQEENTYVVHCLDDSLVDGLKDNPFEEVVKAVVDE